MKSRIGYSNLFVLLVLLLPHAACAAAGGLPARVDTLEAAVANLQTTVNNLNSSSPRPTRTSPHSKARCRPGRATASSR